MSLPHPRGEDHPRARLTSTQVAKGRQLRAEGVSVDDSMSRLKIPASLRSAFHNAVRGSSWKWMDDPPGVPRLPRDSRDALLAQSFEDGSTTYEAGSKLGVSQGTAWRAVDRLVPSGHHRRRKQK